MFDTIIRQGHVIDGACRPRFRADVGIRQGLIAAVGSLEGAGAQEEINAQGKIVAPGFIDVHNHSDGWMINRPHLTAKTLQGFTTEVLMADGVSYAPVNEHTAPQWLFYLRSLNGLRMEECQNWRSLEEFMRRIDRRNAQNAMFHVPYANVRSLACGWKRGRADDFHLRQIVGDIRQGMEEGAVGLSTGLDYLCQFFASTDEIVAALAPVAEVDGLYVTHIRYKRGLLPALAEAVEIGRCAGVKVHISHLKAQSPQQVEQVLEFVDRVASQEVDFSFDVYPYQPGSTMLNYLLPYEVWEQGPLAAMHRLTDPAIQANFARGPNLRLPLDRMRIAWTATQEGMRHAGKTLSDYVAETGLPTHTALINLLWEERLAVLLVFDEGDDRLVHPFLSHKLHMLGSDGIYFDQGRVHPRVYGSVGRMLGPCVRELRLFSLEEAVYKLSGWPAQRFGAPNRGVLREGAAADVVVFDPETICDRATYESPHQPTFGVEHVLVGGAAVIRNGEPVESIGERLPGRFLQCVR